MKSSKSQTVERIELRNEALLILFFVEIVSSFKYLFSILCFLCFLIYVFSFFSVFCSPEDSLLMQWLLRQRKVVCRNLFASQRVSGQFCNTPCFLERDEAGRKIQQSFSMAEPVCLKRPLGAGGSETNSRYSVILGKPGRVYLENFDRICKNKVFGTRRQRQEIIPRCEISCNSLQVCSINCLNKAVTEFPRTNFLSPKQIKQFFGKPHIGLCVVPRCERIHGIAKSQRPLTSRPRFL